MPSDLTMKLMNAVNRLATTVSGGRLGWTLYGMPVIELTTTGRRSGRRHAVMLTSPLTHGEAYVVVASKGGEDKPPAWLLNLQADPRVLVRVRGGEPEGRTARVATAAERAALWPDVVRAYPHYAAYQDRTDREIALVLLEPA